MQIAAIAIAVVVAGCRLGPLVDDVPGGSSHILPASATVPSVADDQDLVRQITLNDGIDDATDGVVPRLTGATPSIHYWSFGPANRAPSPIYEFYDRVDASLSRNMHPALVAALPGDPGYNPLHTVWRVVTTAAYQNEQIPSLEALTDAVELGLIEEPAPVGTFVDAPIVLPGTKLEVGPGMQVTAETVYARGHAAGMFRLGGMYKEQPGGGALPTMQVSFLHGLTEPGYNTKRPIFQATPPTAPPPAGGPASYSALSVVLDVDLDTSSDTVTTDGDLFTRSPTGEITATSNHVLRYNVTTSILVLQLQFKDGEP